MQTNRYLSNTIFLKFLLLLFISPVLLLAQPTLEKDIFENQLIIVESVPENLLAARSVVLYESRLSLKELQETQKAFQQTGIDAVAYFAIDRILAGADPQKAFSTYLKSRNISFIILFTKEEQTYSFTFAPFNGKNDLVNNGAAAWQQKGVILNDVLLTIYRFAVSNQKKQNLLINDVPETDIALKYFVGRRTETYTPMVKSFKVAVPKFGNEKDDALLEEILKEHFPVKYELVDPDLDERELEGKGFITVLRFVHTSGLVAKTILDYDVSQIANSIASVAMVKGEAQLKTIPAEETIYKFYIKHLEYGNLFLGNKWDADRTWQAALTNHLQLMRMDLKY